MTLPHTTGTITLTNGSPNIVGVGTDWQTAGIVGGIVFPVVAGNVLPILSVQSNTQMTAAVPWVGASGTYSYSLVRDTAYLQQITENAALFTTIVRELRYASLASLAALAPTMGADKLPFASSANAMAWTPFTAYGRQLVAATTDAGFASAAKVVRRSGGSNMTTYNDIMIGWHSATGGLIGQVDTVYLGNIWNDYYATTQGGAPDIRSKIGAMSSNGGTVSGSLHAAGNLSAAGNLTGNMMYNISAANADGALYFQTGVVGGTTYNRWAWVKSGYGVGEPGGNASADMKLMRWNDANGYLGTSFVAERKSGAVHTPDTPLLCTNMGADITIAGGNTLVGISDGAMLFNRGGFALGGNLNGRNAVHFPLDGWYHVSMFVAGSVQGAGVQTAVELLRNGTGVVGALVLGPGYMTQTMTILVRMTPNDWFAYRISTSPFLFTGWNTRLTAQWLHP